MDINQEELFETKLLCASIKNEGVPDNLRVGDMMYLDLDGDGAITATGDPKRGYQGDLVYLGTSNPRYNFGLNIDMEWKGFDLSIFFKEWPNVKLYKTENL